MYNGLQGGNTTNPLQNAATASYLQPAAPPPNDVYNNWQPVQAPIDNSGSQQYQNVYSQPAAPTIDWQAVAGYDQGIGNVNSQLGQIAGQRNVGLSNIDSSYNSALNQLLQGKARSQTTYDTTSRQALEDYNLAKAQAAQQYGTLSDQSLQDYTTGKTQANQRYTTTKQQTAQDYIGSKNSIRSQAGASLNGLLRLLGSRGAGGGSAYNTVAPGAVTRQATIQSNDIGQQFGRNQQALDTSYNQGIQGMDTTYGRNKNALDTSYNNSTQAFDTNYGRNTNALNTNWQNYLSDLAQNQSDLTSNKTIQENDLQAGIDRNQATLLEKLALLSSQRSQAAGNTGVSAITDSQPLYEQANALYAAANSLGQHPAITQRAPANYVAPSLAAQTLYTPPALAAQAPYQTPSLASYTTQPGATPTVQGQASTSDYISPYLASLLGKRQTV